MSFCKLPQYIMCIILCHVHYNDSQIYTFLLRPFRSNTQCRIMAFLCYTFLYYPDLKILHHGSIIHPQRCAKPSLPNLYMSWCLHPYTVMASFVCTMPSLILGPLLYVMYYIKISEHNFQKNEKELNINITYDQLTMHFRL